MENLNKTHSQILMEKGEAIGEVRGKLEGKLEQSLEIAKKLFCKMSIAEIAQITDLPLEKIEELVPNA